MKVRASVVPAVAIAGKQVVEIEPPETRIFLGHGDTTVVCGKCSCVLADGVHLIHLDKMLLKCNMCKSINQVIAKKA